MRLAAALAIGLAACASAPPHRPGEERLAAIKFEGNQQLSSKTLVAGLALRRAQQGGRGADPYQVQLDADRIRGQYLREGYLDIDVRPRVERKGDDATVIYTVEEGARAKARIVINGLPPDVPVSAVRDKLPLADGAPFHYESYDLAKPLLLGAVQDAGYAHAQLDANVVADRANRLAYVELDYTPGPKCTFGNIEIVGAKGELETAVRDRLAFSAGQVYSTQAITQTQRNLYGLGRFSTVRVTPEQNAGEVVGVKVDVSESARRQIQLGGGFGIDPNGYEVRGRAGYSIAGWPFPLDTVSLDFRPAYAYIKNGVGYEPRIRAIAKLERQDLFWTYAKGQVEGGYSFLTVEAYTSYGPLARLGFETPLGIDKLKLRVGWSFQQLAFRNISPLLDPPDNVMDQDAMNGRALAQRLGLNSAERIGGYQQAVVLDLRDHPLEPRLGAYGEVRSTEGTQLAGGAFNYLQLMSDARGYVPLFAGMVLAGRARYGAIWGDIPVTERFFAGGAVSQRGFGERQLSPSIRGVPPDMNGERTGAKLEVPYGGGGLFETSLEARVPITKVYSMPLGFVTFLDGGDVVETPGDLDFGNLHWAAGGGLRLQTVVGPVRLDVGYRLNRTNGLNDPAPGTHFAYHLSIGEAF
jgi:outer membrane protein assembly factor BamA